MKRQYQAEYIKRVRLESELKQYEMAKKMGVTAQFYGRVEKGEVGIPLSKTKAFIKAAPSCSRTWLARVISYDLYLHVLKKSR